MIPRRNLTLIIATAGLLVFGGRLACRALASDETKIRWRIEEMLDGFNDCKTGRVLDGLASDFRDRASGATRQDVHAALVQLFFELVDSRTHEFQLNAELVEEDLAIRVEPTQPKCATADVHVLIRQRKADGATVVFWDAHVSGLLEQRDDGWQWLETTSVNHRDRGR